MWYIVEQWHTLEVNFSDVKDTVSGNAIFKQQSKRHTFVMATDCDRRHCPADVCWVFILHPQVKCVSLVSTETDETHITEYPLADLTSVSKRKR